MGIFSDYMSEEADMQTVLFRNTVMVEAFGKVFPGDVKCVQTFDNETAKMVLRRPYSEQNDRLIFLFAAGVLNKETFIDLMVHNDSNFLSDVIAAENYVRKSEGEIEEDILSYELVSNILLLCANSKKVDGLSPIDFLNASQLISNSHITLTRNGFIHCDRELTEFLHSLGEPFGFYDVNVDEKHMQMESQENFIIEAAKSEDYDTDPEAKPLAMNYSHLSVFLSVYDEIYGKDFIKYAADNNLAIDEKFRQSYEEYLKETKLKFSFKAYYRKQHICGNKVNSFDYSTLNVEDNKLVAANLNSDNEYSKEISLEPSEYIEEKELMSMALRKYKNSRQLYDDMVLEVIHCNKKYLFINRKGNLVPVDISDFHRELFDFNKIWSIIQKCSREKKIVKCGDEIRIPAEYMEEIPVDQHIYVINMITEQYRINKAHQRNNPVMHSINDIRLQASNNMKRIAEEKAQQAAEKAAKRAERNQGLAKISKPAEN